MASGRRAWTAARASVSRAAGVTAASVAVLIRAGGSGRIIVSGRGALRIRAAGSAKIRPFFLQCRVRDRSAVRVLRRWWPRSAAIAAAASPAVTSRR